MPKNEVTLQASILKRIGAFLIDMIILNLFVLFPFRGMVMDSLPKDASPMQAFEFMEQTDVVGLIMVIFLMVSIICILYFVFFERKFGQTPGKMLFKLQVIGNEKEVRTWQYFVRSLFLVPIFPIMLLWIIDPIVMLFTKEHNRLCEIMSKTKTIEMVSL